MFSVVTYELVPELMGNGKPKIRTKIPGVSGIALIRFFRPTEGRFFGHIRLASTVCIQYVNLLKHSKLTFSMGTPEVEDHASV